MTRNRTAVSCVTGRNTNHYTITDFAYPTPVNTNIYTFICTNYCNVPESCLRPGLYHLWSQRVRMSV